MLYNAENISTLDLSKYKRFIAIGCSFTQWSWPSWADVIAYDLNDDTEYVNLAKQGASNEYILTNLSQAKTYYDLKETDLVGIMWTTFYRQCSYRNTQTMVALDTPTNNWQCPGNIYTQGDIPRDVVDKYYNSVRGFAVRNLATIDITLDMLKSANFDSFTMWGVHPSLQNHYGSPQKMYQHSWVDVEAFYKNLDKDILPDLLGYGMDGSWSQNHIYYNEAGEISHDYHPTSAQYFEYLRKINFPVTSNMESFSSTVTNYINQNVKTEAELRSLNLGAAGYRVEIL